MQLNEMKWKVTNGNVRWFLVLLLSGLPWLANGQLIITNGVQTYAALTSTNVTMSGRCELRVTSTNAP